MISPSEPYVPFFHAKGDNGDVAKDPHPPLIPLKTTEGYDNQGTHNYLCTLWISAVIDVYCRLASNHDGFNFSMFLIYRFPSK